MNYTTNFIDKNLGKILIVIFLIATSLVIFAAANNVDYTDNLMQECMKDRPEYECYSMIKRNNRAANCAPVVIPMGR